MILVQIDLALTLLVILVVAFLTLTLFVMRAPAVIDELTITHRIQAITVRGFGPLLHLVNVPGYPPQVLVLGFLLVAVPFLFGWKWIAFTQAFAGLGVGLAATVVKYVVHRRRPSSEVVLVHRVLDRGGQSYPAGHAADYLARFGFIIYLLTHSGMPAWWVPGIITILGVLIGLVGLARIYSGEHWLTDVLGGYLLGGIWLLVTIIVYNWTDARIFVESHL